MLEAGGGGAGVEEVGMLETELGVGETVEARSVLGVGVPLIEGVEGA